MGSAWLWGVIVSILLSYLQKLCWSQNECFTNILVMNINLILLVTKSHMLLMSWNASFCECYWIRVILYLTLWQTYITYDNVTGCISCVFSVMQIMITDDSLQHLCFHIRQSWLCKEWWVEIYLTVSQDNDKPPTKSHDDTWFSEWTLFILTAYNYSSCESSLQ